MTTVLLAANSGGHILELHSIIRGVVPAGDRLWFVPESSQSRDLVGDDAHVWSDPAPSRDFVGTAKNYILMKELLSRSEVGAVVSTGSSLALSSLVPASGAGIASIYIESAARVHGPSLSGRLLQRVHAVHRFAQHPGFGGRRWEYVGSVFDSFEVSESERRSDRPLKVFVTLGTSKRYRFDRLVAAINRIAGSVGEVAIQSDTALDVRRGIEVIPRLSHSQLYQRMADSDVVVSHAGVGSALTALDAGKFPILVPRVKKHREHVDDHQREIASVLQSKNLAISVDAEQLGLNHVIEAAQHQAFQRPTASRMSEALSDRLRLLS